MKATITNCLAELVEARFGKDKWAAILSDSGLQSHASVFRLPTSDIPEDEISKVLASTCKVLRIDSQQAADAFGEYWCCTYAPRLYSVIVKRFKNAKEMILGLDCIHVMMTATIPNARPPRFDYNWENDSTLNVTYKSNRNMIYIYIGLVKGVGKFFKESLVVTKVSPQRVKIVFGLETTGCRPR
jgi:Haem-NO-binding